MSEINLFTSESVSEGHPDKMADQISDAILHALLNEDPRSRVAWAGLTGSRNWTAEKVAGGFHGAIELLAVNVVARTGNAHRGDG